MAMCKDKAFLEDAEKIGVDISPIDGDGVLEMLGAHSAAHAEGRDRALQRDQRGESETRDRSRARVERG